MLSQLFESLRKTEFSDTKQIEMLQMHELQLLVNHHKENSLWYKKLLDGKNSIPIITKQDIINAGVDYYATTYPQHQNPVRTTKTSGSTGEPLEMRVGHLSSIFYTSYALRELLWTVKEPNLKSTVIKANIGEYIETETWGEPFDNVMSTGKFQAIPIVFDIKEINRLLTEFQPNILLAYPNTLKGLCDEWRDNSFTLKELKYIRTMGETLTQEIRDYVFEITGIKVRDTYSSQEVGCLAIQCPDNNDLYHTMDENVIVEILDDNNQPVKENEIGKVVITDLHNFVAPIIRYQNGDYATRGSKCSCGRGLKTIKNVMGRSRNLLHHPDGRKHWPLVGFYNFFKIAPVTRFQLIQHNINDLELKLATPQQITEEQRNQFIDTVKKSVGYDFNVTFTHFIGDLPKSKNGKHESFISHI